jgi:PAT family beta-lactamase induction signal transducer AmpG
MLCVGAGALYIADFASWRAAYLAMAGLTLVGIGGCLASPRLDRPLAAIDNPDAPAQNLVADTKLVIRYSTGTPQRLGLMPSLILGGLAATTSHLTLALLAAHGTSLPLLTLSVSAESFASGFAGAALIAYMSSLVSPAFAATQYALLSSLYALPGKLIGGLSGVMVDEFGYPLLHRHCGDRHSRCQESSGGGRLQRA